MIGDYEALTEFVRSRIVEPRMNFNQLRTTTSAIRSIIDRFERFGWTSEVVPVEEGRHPRHRLLSPDGAIELAMNSAKVSRHPHHTEVICQRKHLTKRMLEFDNLPTPPGADFSSREKLAAKAFFEKIPKPVVVKPTNSGGSSGVTVGVSDSEAFEDAWKFALAEGRSDSSVLIEKFMRGVELRAMVVGGEALSIVARVQPFVAGNGVDSLATLIEASDNDRKSHYRAMQLPVVFNWEFIRKQGYDNESIPGDGKIVFLNPLGLPVAGALLVDVTDTVSPEIKSMAVRATAAIPGLEIGGIDILVEDLEDPATAVILEVNTAPSLNLHRYTTHGQSRAVELDIVDYFHSEYLKENGRANSVA
ncbi:ATP-binding protein [Agrococcus casei]|uniref:ATP-binding protein n=1 Tax=Agrococcus casei TaxID=343512 RepID=UPI003F9CBCAF